MKKRSNPTKSGKSPKSPAKTLSEKLGGPYVPTPDPDHGGGGGEDPVDYDPSPITPRPAPN
jgi:hypothetical protein